MKRLLLILSCTLGGCSSPPDRTSIPTTSRTSNDSHERTSLNLDYTDCPKVTETPFPVALDAFFDCAAPALERAKQHHEVDKQHGPHAKSYIVVRVNSTGLAQFKAGKSVPEGTVVVKEKHPVYEPNAQPVAIAVMFKREPGYDPEHGDWEYAYELLQTENARKVERGKIESCIDCHKGTRSTDYLFRPYLKIPAKQ